MTDAAPRLIRSVRLPDAVEARIRSDFTAPPPPENPLNTQSLLELAHSYAPTAIILTHTAPLRQADIARLPDSVRLVATVSVGLDPPEVPALLAPGLHVPNTPDVLTDRHARLARPHILVASRRAAESLLPATTG